MDKETTKVFEECYDELAWELEHWAKIRNKADKRIEEIRFKLAQAINHKQEFESSQDVVSMLMENAGSV